jgi:hypothetical protein
LVIQLESRGAPAFRAMLRRAADECGEAVEWFGAHERL